MSCPSGKKGYRHKQAAERAAKEVERCERLERRKPQRRRVLPKHAYECRDCAQWHWGHDPVAPQGRRQ